MVNDDRNGVSINQLNNGSGKQRRYLHQDRQLSVRMVTDEGGAVNARYDYDPHGQHYMMPADGQTVLNWDPTIGSGGDWFAKAGRVRFGYTGQRYDPETGLWHFKKRYLHPELGRFVSRDPAGYVDGMSLYRAYFVATGIDPLGLQALSFENFGRNFRNVTRDIHRNIGWYDQKPTYGPATSTNPSGLGNLRNQQSRLSAELGDIESARELQAQANKAGEMEAALGGTSEGLDEAGRKIVQTGKEELATGGAGRTLRLAELGATVAVAGVRAADGFIDDAARLLPPPPASTARSTLPDNGTFYVDPNGNTIPTPPGGTITSSPDARYIQARDANGDPTGIRIDGGHNPKTHKDPRALGPHGHVPGVANPDGTPWLPVNEKPCPTN